MKKFTLAAAGFLMAFSAFVPAAHAYYLIDGQRVTGYVSYRKPEPGPEQAFVEKIQPTPQPPINLFGNTTVYDLAARLRPEDRAILFGLVDRAGIKY